MNVVPSKTVAALFLAITGFLAGPCPARAEQYAMLFSGGADMGNNFDRYYDQTCRMWDLLVNKWGYNMDNVYVLFADGTDPSLDRLSYREYRYVSSDWSGMVNAGGHINSATRNDFTETLQLIGDRMEPGRDSFMLWSYDHGSQTSPATPGSGSLVTWMSDNVYSSEISSLLQPITSKDPIWDAYVFNQCYAGDMANGLGITGDDPNRFVTWAAQWNETSYDAGFAKAWADGMDAGLFSTHALGDYAITHDIYGPSGHGFEHPGWIGGDFVLTDVPEPSSGLVLALGLAAFTWSRRRTGRDRKARQGLPAGPLLLAACALLSQDTIGRADTEGDFVYEVGDGVVSITGYTGSNGIVIVPETILGMPVTTIEGNAFSYCTRLTNITLPGSLIEIGPVAFSHCTNLTGATIPNAVTDISMSAFLDCGLTEIDIPASVRYIGFGAFADCDRLAEIRVDPLNAYFCSEDGVLFDRDRVWLMQYPAGKTGAVAIPGTVNIIDAYAFQGCTGLSSVSIPGNVTNIMSEAFRQCSALTNITIPDSVRLLGALAFYGCARLKEIVLSDGLTSLREGLFYGCTNLVSVRMPASLASIEDMVFYRCARLQNLNWPGGLKTIGERAFLGCTRLGNASLPDGTTSIGTCAFYGCASLTNVVIPASMTSIGASAFACSRVLDVTIPNPLTTLGLGAFSDCGSLTNAAFPEGMTRIACSAFDGCSNLVRMTMPGSVTNIGNNAFHGCARLSDITIPNGVTEIGMSAFSGCRSLLRVAIPDSVTFLGDDAFANCSSLADVSISSRLSGIRSRAFANCASLTNAVIPDGVTNIAIHAFEGCSSLTEIAIPASVASIGASAFSDCARLTAITVDPLNPAYCSVDGVLFNSGLKTLVACPGGVTGDFIIPNTITNLGSYAFRGCTGLTNVMIPGGVTRIGDYAFQGCTGLAGVAIPDSVTFLGYDAFQGCSSLANVTISTNIASIGGGAFANCTCLTQVIIPKSVTRLDGGAFFACTNLTGAYFEWNAPGVGVPNVFSGARNLVVYHRPGTIGWGATFCGYPTALWTNAPLSYGEWAEAVGLAAGCSNAVCETDDPDGDGMNNLQEMQSGTDPADVRSVLAFEREPRMNSLSDADKTPVEGNQQVLYFQSVPGRTYAIQGTDSLSGGWKTKRTVHAITAQTRVTLDKPERQEFYRLMVVP